MKPTDTSVDRDAAHERLARSATITLASQRDRSMYAIATAVLGVALAGLMILSRALDSVWQTALLNALFLAVVIGAEQVVERRTKATPRHSRRWLMIGVGGSMLAALFVALPVLNLRAQTASPSLVMQLVAVCGVALPCWVAAIVISRTRR